MFESSLLESSSSGMHQASIWTKGLSFTLEALLLSLAVLAPLLYTEALPKHVLDVVESPAPPSTSTQRPSSVVVHPQIRSELNDRRILLPSAIPRHVVEIQDEGKSDGNSSGEEFGGVVGAVPGDTSDRTIASLLRTLPPTMPKSVTPRSVRISSGVAQGLLVHEVRPQYPPLAHSARIQGAVVLQATIGKDGTIHNLHLVSGHPLLTQAALEAVRHWRYRPYLLNEEAVEVDTTIVVNFTLAGGAGR